MTCAFMAKPLIASESLNKIDQKIKKELQEVFKQAQRKRREKRLKNIPTLYDNYLTMEVLGRILTNYSQKYKEVTMIMLMTVPLHLLPLQNDWRWWIVTTTAMSGPKYHPTYLTLSAMSPHT
jgi:hypothetical protein